MKTESVCCHSNSMFCPTAARWCLIVYRGIQALEQVKIQLCMIHILLGILPSLVIFAFPGHSTSFSLVHFQHTVTPVRHAQWILLLLLILVNYASPCLLTTTRDGSMHGSGTSRATTASPKPFFRASWRVGQRRGWQRKCWMDNITEWTSLPVPELLTKASCKKKDWRMISAEPSLVSPFCRRPDRSRDWTERTASPWYNLHGWLGVRYPATITDAVILTNRWQTMTKFTKYTSAFDT